MSLPTSALASVRRAGLRRASLFAVPPRSRAASSAAPTPSPNPAPGPPRPNAPFVIFDRAAKATQRSRAALRRPVDAQGQPTGAAGEASRETDYVKRLVAESVAERVLDIKKDLPVIVELGAGAGFLRHYLDPEASGCKKIIMCDPSREALHRDEHLDADGKFEIERRIVDEENLPFEENSLDCIVSIGALHWTNDLPGALVQIQRALKPDGVFIGALHGGDTLFELRTSLQLAEQEREGGISPRISPMTDTRDMSNLLSRAGFAIPTVDTDEVEIQYPSIFELMHDLRDMGESNAVINRRGTLQRDTLIAASAIYQAMHGSEDGTVPATFATIYCIGWKPAASQMKPLKRGSASHSMKDALAADSQQEVGKDERDSGDGKR
ncbi:S-adenosyl-L-methionine-dependent methyltransferase [Tilletiopsis washingtonensis]|uniref:S-adenosyl-L-methionine-dependent methyltransferase n=1 Tax=Tilletiopsis washingtonensis TaxID=58919 RepID=A0A316ZL11_9BASI|nr:S-adenosyl-L-methionine-dependent methyltransferase [Tilletiopsis washingtonensis]PWO01004.1 S-adenosyl-L-methionine-dependent methyltransferase [Tilletiopsis washingtonensis]